jgi:hypothetical protein
MLIGLSGVGGAGKDEVAKVLVAEYGFKQLALATKMKEAALALDPIIDFDVDGHPLRLSDLINEFGPEEAKKHPEVRRTYQRMGTEVGRNTLDEQLWIKLVFALVRDRRADSDIVISDVRFVNEARYIGARGHVWRITRPGAGLEGEAAEHISEWELSDDTEGLYDYFLHNDGTLGDLKEKVAFALKACGR